MPDWLIPLIPAAPLLACLFTAISGPWLLKQNSHWPCWLGVGVSFVLSLGLLIVLITTSGPFNSIHVYDWLLIGLPDNPELHVPIAFHIDRSSREATTVPDAAGEAGCPTVARAEGA